MLYLVSNEVEAACLVGHVSDLLQKLYQPLGAITVARRRIAFCDLRWSGRVLSESRLQDCRNLVDLLIRSKAELFPLGFRVSEDGACRVVAPPIVEAYYTERRERRYLLLDGSHRCYAALPCALEASVLAVSFVSLARPLPCKPLLASEVRVEKSQPRLSELFLELSETDFRPVRQLAHKQLRFDSLPAALASTNVSASSLIPLTESSL